MSKLGIIGLAAAIANYRRAKKAYEDALKECPDAAVAATISQYDDKELWKQFDEYNKPGGLIDSNDTFSGILPIPILNIGMLVGNKCRIKPQVVFAPMTSEAIKIYGVGIQFCLFGQPFLVAVNDGLRFDIAGSRAVTVTFPLPTAEAMKENEFVQNSLLGKAIANSMEDVYAITPELQWIKDYLIKKYQNSGLQTTLSIPENTIITSIQGRGTVVTANIEIKYATSSDTNIRRAIYKDVPGSFVYHSEHYYPGGGNWIIE